MTEYMKKVSSYPYGQFGDANTTKCVTEFGRQGFRGDELYWPWFCDVSNTGDIAVADTDNNRIQIFQTKTYTSIFPPYGGQGVRQGEFNRPCSVKYCTLPGANLAVADTGNRRVSLLRINLQLGKIEFAHSFGQTLFQEPTDLAIDRRLGNIVVVDSGRNKVTIHNQYGQCLGELQQSDYKLDNPSGIAITHDGKSEIFVADTGNHCIRRYKCNGDYEGKIGQFGSAAGEFNAPRGLAFDRRGYLYVADEHNNRVQMLTPDLQHVAIVANVPAPKGVAAGLELIVTTGDQTGFIKVFS